MCKLALANVNKLNLFGKSFQLYILQNLLALTVSHIVFISPLCFLRIKLVILKQYVCACCLKLVQKFIF